MKDPEFIEKSLQELSRRLGMDHSEMMETPIIEIARKMGDRNVSMGLQLVTESPKC